MALWCFYCGKTMLERGTLAQLGRQHPLSSTIDHVVPRRRLDPAVHPVENFEWRRLNEVKACSACNHLKGMMWPLDWLEVMPDDGVIRLQKRLLALGCAAIDISAAMARRSARTLN